MPMADAFLNAAVNAGTALITHIGLVNGSGVELASAGYARQAVTWNSAVAGLRRPTADLVFNMTAGDVVGGWRGFSASSAGTNYGGASVTTKTFANDGTYTLLAASTAIDLDAA